MKTAIDCAVRQTKCSGSEGCYCHLAAGPSSVKCFTSTAPSGNGCDVNRSAPGPGDLLPALLQALAGAVPSPAGPDYNHHSTPGL